MKNINLQKQHSLGYSQVFFNKKEVKRVTNNHLILQSKLDLVSDLVFEGFSKMIDFMENDIKNCKDLKKHSSKLALFNDVATEYIRILKNGPPLLSTMSNQLKGKKISQDTFKLLLKIINYQIETTREIVNKELTDERIDVVFNHLRDTPYYLRSDLELENLPELKTISKNANKIQGNSWHIVGKGYNPDRKSIA